MAGFMQGPSYILMSVCWPRMSPGTSMYTGPGLPDNDSLMAF